MTGTGPLVIYRSRTKGWLAVALGLLPLTFGYWFSRNVAGEVGGAAGWVYLGLAAIGGCLVLVGLLFALGRKVTMIVGPDTLTLGQMWGPRQTVLAWDEIAGIEVVTHRYKASTTRQIALMLTDAAACRRGRPGHSGKKFFADHRFNDVHLSIEVYALADILVARAVAAGRIVTGPETPYGGAIHDHKRWLLTEAPPEGA